MLAWSPEHAKWLWMHKDRVVPWQAHTALGKWCMVMHPSHCTFTIWRGKQDLQVTSQEFHTPEKPESPEHPTQQQGHQLHQSCGIREVKLIGLLPANRPGLQMILPTARAQTKDCDTTSQSAAAVTGHSSSVPASAQPQTCSRTHNRYEVTDLGSVSSARTQLIHRVLEALWGKAAKKRRWQFDCLYFKPVKTHRRLSAVNMTTWKFCVGTGKVLATKTFRMALTDQDKKDKGISNSPNLTP